MRKITHYISLLIVAFMSATTAWAQLTNDEVANIHKLLEECPAAVGYPGATHSARTLLEDMLANPTNYAKGASTSAINAFYNATDVMMPEAGKKYTISYVCYNGNKFYAEEKVEDGQTTDIALTPAADVSNPAEQSSLHFTCQVTEDGKFNFVTNNGKYYTIHSQYNGSSWMQASTTGFTETYDAQRNDIELLKLTVEYSNVQSWYNSDLGGIMYIRGLRGIRNENSEPVTGCLVILADGSNYDGADAPYFNDRFSSGVMITEVPSQADPIELLGVTPEGGVENPYEAFPAITLQFNQPVSIDATKEITVSARNAQTEATASVEMSAGDVTIANITVSNADESGYYLINIPAGLFTTTDGALSEEINLYYLIEIPVEANTYTYASTTPENGAEVEQLDDIVISYTSDNYPGGISPGKLIKITRDGQLYTVASVIFDDNNWDNVIVDLTTPITEAGTYTVTIPEKTIWNMLYDESQEDYGVSRGAIYNPEYVLTFTVVPAETGEPLGEPIKSLSELSNEKCYVLHNPIDLAYAVYDPNNGNNIWAANDEEGTFHEDAAEFDKTSANSSWMAVKGEGGTFYLYNMGIQKYLQTPAWRANDQVCTAATFSDKPVSLTVLTREDGYLAITAHPEDDHTYLCASAGSPDRLISIWTMDDHGCAWQFKENPNIAADPSVVEKLTSIVDAIANSQAPKAIYNLSGVKMNVKNVNKLPKGVYIVDGKKVVVK